MSCLPIPTQWERGKRDFVETGGEISFFALKLFFFLQQSFFAGNKTEIELRKLFRYSRKIRRIIFCVKNCALALLLPTGREAREQQQHEQNDPRLASQAGENGRVIVGTFFSRKQPFSCFLERCFAVISGIWSCRPSFRDMGHSDVHLSRTRVFVSVLFVSVFLWHSYNSLLKYAKGRIGSLQQVSGPFL